MLYAGNTALADILPLFLSTALRDFLKICFTYRRWALTNFRQLKAFAKTTRVSTCLLHSISWGKLVILEKGPQPFFVENGPQG